MEFMYVNCGLKNEYKSDPCSNEHCLIEWTQLTSLTAVHMYDFHILSIKDLILYSKTKKQTNKQKLIQIVNNFMRFLIWNNSNNNNNKNNNNNNNDNDNNNDDDDNNNNNHHHNHNHNHNNNNNNSNNNDFSDDRAPVTQAGDTYLRGLPLTSLIGEKFDQ